MDNYTIKDMEISDISEVTKIHKSENFVDSWSYNSFFNELENPLSQSKVVIFDKKVVAFSIIRVIVDEIELINIAVDKNYRRKNIAQNLFDHILNFANNMAVLSIYLEVRESNKAAINFYEKNGFYQISKRKKYYIDGETALIMLLKL